MIKDLWCVKDQCIDLHGVFWVINVVGSALMRCCVFGFDRIFWDSIVFKLFEVELEVENLLDFENVGEQNF